MFSHLLTAKTPQFVTYHVGVLCGLQGASRSVSERKPQANEAKDEGNVVDGLYCFVGVLKVQNRQTASEKNQYIYLFTLQTYSWFVFVFFKMDTLVTKQICLVGYLYHCQFSLTA